MERKRTIAIIGLCVRVVCLCVALALVLVAYQNSNLPALGGALIAAALAFRSMDLSALHRKSASDASLPATAGAVEGGEALKPGELAVAARQFVTSRPVAAQIVAAVICAVAATLMPSGQTSVFLSALAWLGGLSLVISAMRMQDRRDGRALPAEVRLDRTDILFALVIGGIALLVRAYDLADYPPYMHGDEGTQGVSVLRVIGGYAPPFAFPGNPWGFPFALDYIQSFFVRLLGPNETGLRITSALFGALSVALTYCAARVAFRSRIAGIAAGLILATLHAHVYYSRLALGMEVVPWLPLIVLALAQTEGTPTKVGPASLLPSTLAGIAAALAQYGYAAGRLALVLLPLYVLHLAVRKRFSWAHLGALSLGFVVAAAPLLFQFVSYPAAILARSGVNVFSPDILRHTLGPGAELPRDLGPLLSKQLLNTFSALVSQGDTSGFYASDIPFLEPVTAVLFWIGLGLALLRLKRFGEYSVIVWLALTLVIGVALTVDPPGGPRMIIAHPAIAMLAGYAVNHLWLAITSVAGATLRWLAAPLLAALLIVAGASNLDIFFNKYSGRMDYSDGIHIAREFAQEPKQYYAFLIGDSVYGGYSVTRYIASEATIKTVSDTSGIPAPGQDGRGILIIAMPPKFREFDDYRTRYPGGQESSYSIRGNPLLYRVYRIPSP